VHDAISSTTSNNLQGVVFALLATALFAIAAAMAKHAVLEFRSIWALAVLPLTTAITLGFAQVFFIVLLAALYLGEKVGVHRFAAVGLGFFGVVIAMRPGVAGVFDVHALIPVAGALGAGVAIVMVRKLSKTESTQTLLVYQSLFVGLLACAPLFWLWKSPSLPWMLFLLAMGVVATKALRLGEASVVGHVHYMQLVYAALIGFFIFDELPDNYTIAGAVLIIASSGYVMHRERLAKRRAESIQ